MRNFKKLLLPAVVALVLAAVNFCLNYALIPYSYVRIMMHQIETQEYDTLFLGTSHGLNGISPKIIEEKTGGRVMNLCLGGEYPKDAYYLLKQACNTTLQLFHKKNVIQDFLMYNKFANKKIRKKVILYDRLIIQRKNYNW